MSVIKKTSAMTLDLATFSYLAKARASDLTTYVALKDAAHRYVFANEALETLYGVEKNGLLGLTMYDLPTIGFLNSVAEIHAKETIIINTGAPAQYVEKIYLNGDEVSLLIVRFPYVLPHSNEKGVGFIAYKRDVEDSVELEKMVTLDALENRVLQLQETVRTLERSASIDALTNVWNRDYMKKSAINEIARNARYGERVTVAFADLDHFKRVNDTWGHAMGDEVLKTFCNIASKILRDSDLIGRWGGEEFLMLFPNTSRLSAQLAVERVRFALERYEFPEIGRVTASFGIATLLPNENCDEWLARADAALYRAKWSGRNCIELDYTDFGNVGSTESPSRIVWEKTYFSGNAEIDDAHIGVITKTNELLDKLRDGEEKEKCAKLFREILDLVETHFNSEEEILKALEYIKYDEHKNLHNNILSQAENAYKRFQEDKLNLRELVNFFVHEIVMNHLLIDDMEFFPLVHKTD